MHSRRTAFVAALAGLIPLVAGCAPEAPYVYTDYRYHQRGQVIVCYSDEKGTPEQVKALADEVCRQYDRVAMLQLQQEYQCSWTAPTQAVFHCMPRPGENPPPIVQHHAPMRHDPALPPE
jgi:dTDP-4-dehydrorhamnose reductase